MESDMNNRKYMVLNTATKSVVLDADGDPVRLVTLEEALSKAVELRGPGSPKTFAVIDDLGNKWLWSAKGAMRVAISNAAKDAVTEAVDKGADYQQISFARNSRCRPDGIVETQHQVRLPDGPPIRDPAHSWGDRMTKERWTDFQWIERGPLSSYIDGLETRVHPLEQRAINDKARSMRAAEKARMQQAAYEAGEEMTCQICGRLICSKLGTIAHHGYTRPGDGWQTASCDGTHEVPFEVSNAHLIATISHLESCVEELKADIAAVREERVPVVVNVRPHWSEGRKYPYTYTITVATYESVAAASDGRLSDSVPFEDRKESHIDRLEAHIKSIKVGLGEMRKRNLGWKQTRVFVDGEFKPFVCEPA
jgi:hypothetical protein